MIFAEANHMTTSTEKERDWQLPLTNLSLSIYVCNIYNPGANTGQHFPLKMYCVCTSAQSLSHVLLFWDPMDCSSPGSSVHGILQARILEWVAIFFSRGSSQPRDGKRVSCIGRRVLYHWATRENFAFWIAPCLYDSSSMTTVDLDPTAPIKVLP